MFVARVVSHVEMSPLKDVAPKKVDSRLSTLAVFQLGRVWLKELAWFKADPGRGVHGLGAECG